MMMPKALNHQAAAEGIWLTQEAIHTPALEQTLTPPVG